MVRPSNAHPAAITVDHCVSAESGGHGAVVTSIGDIEINDFYVPSWRGVSGIYQHNSESLVATYAKACSKNLGKFVILPIIMREWMRSNFSDQVFHSNVSFIMEKL